MNQLWQMWESGISTKIVDSIIQECECYDPAPGQTGFDGRGSNDTRNSTVRWIDKNDKNSKFIADLIWDYGQEANCKAFGFDIDFLNEIQYTVYDSKHKDHYAWHADTFWANPTAYDRKLSIVIQLSDPSEYSGGFFELSSEYEQPSPISLRKKGTVLVFPSFLSHRVTPVTSGVRKSLVSWIQGPKFR
jgi:PKHD-type hydroxylase